MMDLTNATVMKDILLRVKGAKALVIGDVIHDLSLYHRTVRKSNEFDGPIVTMTGFARYAGGAANVAMNCKALGAEVMLLGVVGNDPEAMFLMSQFAAREIQFPLRPHCTSASFVETTLKKRIIIDGAPVCRIDRDTLLSLDIERALECIDSFRPDVVLLSDYRKGVFNNPAHTARLISCLRSMDPVPLIAANPKPAMFAQVDNIDLICVNDAEYCEIHTEAALLAPHTMVMHTMGSYGLEIEQDGCKSWFPAASVDDPDIVGCGDTAFAAAALALSVTGNTQLVGKIAVAAGSAKAMKKGTLPVAAQEIVNVAERE